MGASGTCHKLHSVCKKYTCIFWRIWTTVIGPCKYVCMFLYHSNSQPPLPNMPHDMKVLETSDSSTAITRKVLLQWGWSRFATKTLPKPMPQTVPVYGNGTYSKKKRWFQTICRNALHYARWPLNLWPSKFWWWNASLVILRTAWHGAYSIEWAH